MSNKFELPAALRTDQGKGASRRLRRLGEEIPAIIYGGEESPQMLSLSARKVRKSLENEAVYSHILTINVDGKPQKAVLKALQRHPYKGHVTHMDFLRVTGKEAIHMHVPLHFLNEDKAPGLKASGIFSHIMTDIEIKCLPADLPEFIAIDVGSMDLDDTIHLSQVHIPKGVTLLMKLDDEHDPVVVSLHKPHMAPEEPEEVAVVSEEGEETSLQAGDSADKKEQA